VIPKCFGACSGMCPTQDARSGPPHTSWATLPHSLGSTASISVSSPPTSQHIPICSISSVTACLAEITTWVTSY
jgi:hypothetical protein